MSVARREPKPEEVFFFFTIHFLGVSDVADAQPNHQYPAWSGNSKVCQSLAPLTTLIMPQYPARSLGYAGSFVGH